MFLSTGYVICFVMKIYVTTIFIIKEKLTKNMRAVLYFKDFTDFTEIVVIFRTSSQFNKI